MTKAYIFTVVHRTLLPPVIAVPAEYRTDFSRFAPLLQPPRSDGHFLGSNLKDDVEIHELHTLIPHRRRSGCDPRLASRELEAMRPARTQTALTDARLGMSRSGKADSCI
jgi:hypothetical protein